MLAVDSSGRKVVNRAVVAGERARHARALLADCRLCAHNCGVNRLAGETGSCHAGARARFFSAQVEVSDELELIPTFAIALSGCDLRCDFCITGASSWNPRAGLGLDQETVASQAKNALRNGAKTIMVLGGEPTIHLPDVLELVSRLPDTASLIWKTNARVFGTFLTWLSEKTAPVFVVATANDISHLPPELLRKGRLDEIFFVDLPSSTERQEIFRIHLTKRGRDAASFDLSALADHAKDCSGAEIEEAINSALYDAFYAQQDITTEIILETLSQTVPLAKTMDEQIGRLRSWVEGRARNASVPKEIHQQTNLRRMEL